ncbi:hypothetical protein [Haloparvum sedimenti]|uniref:hypothetical protein n=1 Tax=Haloparvum sedimenti TaxID=1678448 RepID=UPI00071E774D|nr:hypothetical protein [Haloparvum sedimenti]
MVYRFMQQDWILDEVMKTDEYNEPEPATLRATVIDSATDDKFHADRSSVVEEKVENAYKGTDYLPHDGFVEFDGPHLISEMVPDTWLAESLTAPPAVRNLCEDQGLTSWWLEQGREPLSKVNDQGFSGGVLRRRSVSKLLFHVAEYTDNSVVPGGNGEEQVYIVAALGGGTGSGMALDLASELQEGDKQVHLFGVLPHDGAGGLEKTNAHAALSELEYAHLTGEGPFETITLIPHLEELEDNNHDFEMGVVRSILAHQNGVRSGNFTTYITPTTGIATNPPRYTPFTLAAPYTIKYDLEMREAAENAVGEMLDAKESELENEADLYEVIEQYLEEMFPDSAGAEFRGGGLGSLDTEWGRDAAYQLRSRIEDDIRGTLLEQEALELADLGDLVDEIKETIDTAPMVRPPDADGDADDDGESVDPMAEAVDFVNDVPGIIRDRLENTPEFTEISPDDELRYDLVEILKAELTNIETRARIWRAASAITPEHTDLDKGEAEVVRTAIREVIMDPDTELLMDRFQDPSLESMIDGWRSQRESLRTTVGELSEFHETVAGDLTKRANEWNETAYDDAKALAAINEHEESVVEAIDDLVDEVENAVEKVESASTEDGVDAVTLDGIGPLDGMEIEGVAPLNDKLDEIGVGEIDVAEIKRGFGFVKSAKKHKLNHGTGFLGIGRGDDRSDEFETNVTSARETGWFEINPNSPDPSVEETFSCRFTSDRLRRESEIETKRDELIDSLVDAFESAFSEGGEFVSHSLTYTTDGRGAESKTISLPQGLDAADTKTTVSKALRNTDAEDPGTLLKGVLSLDAVDTQDPSSVSDDFETATTRTLVEAYLGPIAKEHAKSGDQLAKLTGENDEAPGLIQRFELLRGLSRGSVELSDVELPKAHEYDQGRETYGRDFARNYRGHYEVELEGSVGRSDGNDHPYVFHDEAKQEHVAGAHDIAESDILEANEDRIVRELVNSVRSLLNGDDGRAPINDLSPTAKGQEVEPNFGNIRVNPVYLSRAYEEEDTMTEQYTAVREAFENEVEIVNNDMYNVGRHSAGDRDEITMVTFIGGLFLDNLKLVTKGNGYKDLYEESASGGFIPAHHTIGVGGMWDRWSTMHEWATADGEPHEGADFGAFVARDTVRNVDQEFMSEVMIADQSDDGVDPRDIFLDMLTTGTYESSIDITQTATEADD